MGVLLSRRRRWLGALLSLLALALVVSPRVAWAHGGGVPRLTNADAGPYWVSVWTQPDPLRVGQAHITVAVSEPSAAAAEQREAGAPILGATVRVAFEPLDTTGETLTVAATHEGAANKLFYEADLELPETGRWQVVVTVEGPDGVGSTSFETQVAPPAPFSWTWVGGLGVAALAAVWIVQKYRGQRESE
jgi:hypothetical protein